MCIDKQTCSSQFIIASSMQAIIKAMLNSPTADQGGYSNLFSVYELKQICQREVKIMPKLKEIHDAIMTVDAFFKAYGKFSELQLTKLISVLEVKCIMFLFNKKFTSRTSYESVKEIMASVLHESRSIDSKLPDMPMLAGSITDASKRRKLESSALRQVGKVSDEELEAKGFKVGAIIKTLKDPDTREQFKIISLNADGTTVNLLPISAGTEPEKKNNAKEAKAKAKAKGRAKANEEQEEHGLTVKRTDLHAYKLVIDQTPVFITDICPLVEDISLVRSIIEGAVKQACLKEMCNSSEDECIVAVGKETRVHATKKFGIGKFSLYPVSPMIAVSEKVMGWTKLGEINIGSKTYGIYMKGGNTQIFKPGSKEAKAGKKKTT